MFAAQTHSQATPRSGWILFVLALLAVAAAGAWATTALMKKSPDRLAQLQARQLPEQSSEQARTTLERAPELGEACIPLLVAGMADERPEVAYVAADVLHDQLRDWSTARKPSSERAMQRLAEALAENLQNFSPASREEASRLADAILQTTPARGTERTLATLVACERVLRASFASRAEPAGPETAALPEGEAEVER